MGNRYVSAAYRELGGLLRGVRVRAGMTATELARGLGWPLTTISRMENGRRASTTTDVIQYVAMCGLKWPEAQPCLEFTRVAEHKQGYYVSDRRIDGSLQSLIFHESLAEHSIIYEPQVIHGLLQTAGYARAYITAINQPSLRNGWWRLFVPEWSDDRFCTCRIQRGSRSTYPSRPYGSASAPTRSCKSNYYISCSRLPWTMSPCGSCRVPLAHAATRSG